MTAAFLRASLGLWRRRAAYHHTKWQDLHASAPPNDPERHKQWAEWQAALAMVVKRSAELAAAKPEYLIAPSAALAHAIGVWEGGKSRDGLFHPYWDSNGGAWTIGHGHTNADDGLRVSSNTKPLTPSEADSLLLHDLNISYAPGVTKALKKAGWKHVDQKPYDAFVDFSYNLGLGYLAKGHAVGDGVTRHSLADCARAVLLYDKAGGRALAGLTKRRHWESQLLQGGSYTVNI